MFGNGGDDIALGQDAGDLIIRIDDDHCADMIVTQKDCGLLNRHARTDGHDVPALFIEYRFY
ncbi:hypothetical protein D3C85_1854690 [compost metagenome]